MSKQNRRPMPRMDARPESKASSFEDVVSLIKERRKYVDWIAALEAKRDQTSPQVFTKVHADYEERLRAVVDKLASHRGTLGEEQAGLRKQLEAIEHELGQHQDQRAETELRAHVGELSAAALTEALRVADTEIERLAGTRTSVETDLARVTEFFAAADGTGTLPAPTQRRSPSGFDELSFLQSVVGASETKAAAPALPAPKPVEPKVVEPKVEPLAAPEVVVVAKPTAPESMPAAPPRRSDAFELERQDDPRFAPQQARVSTPVARVSVEKPVVPPEPAAEADGPIEKAVELKPVAQSRPSIAMHMASMTIEPEDAKPGGFIKADESKKSLLDGITSSAQPGEKPFAANVASNNPLSLKSTTPADMKTLKCRECGAMNDPSEWYCERCGAELSAM